MGTQSLYPRIGLISTSAVSFASSGDNTVISATTGKRLLVNRIWFVVAGATSLTFKNGTTALSGKVPVAANGSFTLDLSDEPWFITSLSAAFVINSTNAVQVSGQVYYTYGT